MGYAQLQRIPNLPELLDIIIDDGSHRFHDQETMLLTLWPRLRSAWRPRRLPTRLPGCRLRRRRRGSMRTIWRA